MGAPLRLGYTSLGLPWSGPGARPLDEVLDVALVEAPFRFFELHVPEPRPGGDPLGADAVRALEVVARGVQQRNAGLALGLGARHLLSQEKHEPSLIAADAEGRERRARLMERAIELAAELGAGFLIFLSGPYPRDRKGARQETPEWARLEAGLERLLTKAEARGVTLALEAHAAHLVASMADVAALGRRFPSPRMKLTADVVHQTLTESAPLEQVYRAHAHRAVHVQLDDVDPSSLSPGAPIKKRLLGEPSTIDLPGAIAGLLAGGYQGAIAVEFLRQDFPEIDPLEYCRKTGAWLTELLERSRR